MTNRQAAQALFISAKGVGYHLGNVYAKLRIHSHEDLAAALRALDGQN